MLPLDTSGLAFAMGSSMTTKNTCKAGESFSYSDGLLVARSSRMQADPQGAESGPCPEILVTKEFSAR